MLSPRQREVLSLIADGARVKQAADQLGIAYRTAKQHSEAAVRALDARSVPNAVAIAMRRGLIA